MTARIRLCLAPVLALCLLAAVVAIASASPTDPTATENLGVHYEQTRFASVLARPDGGVLTVQGNLDGGRIESFDAAGAAGPELAPELKPAEATLYSAAGGKTFVLGYKTLSRLDPDGAVDKSFGTDGTVVPGFGAKAVVELGSGKIAVVRTEVGGTHTVSAGVAVELLNQDGSVVRRAGFSRSLDASGVTLGGVVGVPEISSTAGGGALAIGQNFVLRLNADGAGLAGFGAAGLIDGVFGLVGGHVLPDGSVETVGMEYGGPDEGLVLRRYTPTGKPDTSFGPEGARHLDLGDGRVAMNVASWGADGSVLVGGRLAQPGPCPESGCEDVPIVAAFNPAGELETGFAEAGVLKLAPLAGLADGFESDGVTAIARRPDGSIVIAGNAAPNASTGFLAGLSPKGALLPGFGAAGIVHAPQERPAELHLAGFAPLPGGKVLGLGTTDVGIGDAPVLVRYAADDTLDRSFGAGAGYVLMRTVPDSSPHGATGFAISGDEVLTGVYDTPRSHLLMAHVEDGSPVSTFGAGGTVDLPQDVYTQALAFAPGGDPVVLGHQRVSGPARGEPGVVLRYLPDGTPDPNFRGGGTFTMQLARQAVRGKAILTAADGGILAGGSLGHRFAVVSLLPGGKPDPRFGDRGWAVVNVGIPTQYMTLGQVGPYLYLAGAAGEDPEHRKLILMRFDRHGHLDKAFGQHVVPLESSHPVQILPAGEGVLVVLSNGKRPLLTVTKGGKIRAVALPGNPRFPNDVRASAGEGGVVGWSSYDGAPPGQTYHLARGVLPAP